VSLPRKIEQPRGPDGQIDEFFGHIVGSLSSFRQGVLLRLKRRRGPTILTLLALLAIGLVARALLHTTEPAYGGKTVSAWVRELGLNGGSYGIRVSDGGTGNSIRPLRSPGTNSALFPNSPLYLPDFMQPKPGVTNVYILEESPAVEGMLMSLGEMGALSVTNVRVSIGTRTNTADLPLGLVMLPAGKPAALDLQSIFLPGPVKPGPGLNLIQVDLAVAPNLDPRDALQAIGTPALPYLDRAVRQQDRPFRCHYLRIYRLLGRWAERLLLEPSADAVFTRRAAADALAHMPALDRSSAASLLAALRDPDCWVRVIALYALDRLSIQDPAIVPALTQSMLALPVSEFIDRVEPNGLSGPATIQAVIAALKQREASVRREAVSRLSRIGPKAKVASPALLRVLQDEDRRVRALACQALGVIKGDAQLVVPTMIQALADPDHWVRRNAAETLGLYQADAKAAVPRLLEQHNATNAVEGYCVREALKQIDPEAALKAGIE
jgi:hypothetical protein